MRSVSKIIIFACVCLALRLLLYKLMAIPFGGLATAMCQYDCGWYVRLAQDGYGSDSLYANYLAIPNWAFFPAFPLLLRPFLALTPGMPLFTGLLVSNACFLGFAVVGALYLRATRPAADPLLWVVTLMIFPFGYIFSAIYSESLYDLLLIASVLMLATRRVMACAVLTALLCATRPTGVLMLIPLGVERALYLWSHHSDADRLTHLGEALLPVAIAPLGLSLYMLDQYVQTGDALAFNHVQILWDRVWVGPYRTIADGLAAWDWYLVLQPKRIYSLSYDAAWALLGLGVAGWIAWRRRFTEAWLLAASILLPASTALHSLPRFVATNPFFLLAVFDLISRLNGRLAVAGSFAGMGLLHGVVLVFWFIAANSVY